MTEFREKLEADTLPPVTCVVLNWNGLADTLECLQALQECTYPGLSVVVVDNGSTDDSVMQIRGAFPDILVLESGRNLGFAGGNNIGIRHALAQGAEFVWLLNNDTEPAPAALTELVSKALCDRRIGAVASICYYASEPSRVQAWAGTRVNLWIGYARNSTVPHPDEWLEALYGASFLVRRTALEDVGLLDEGFFLLWEETEFCVRLRKAGWRLAAASASRILHKVSATRGTNNLVIDRHFTASGLRILRLHSPVPLVAMAMFLGMRFVRRLLTLQFSRCRSVWRGFMDYRNAPPEPRTS